MDREPAVPILLVFLGFVLFAREGLVGIGRHGTARLRPGAGSAMADRHATALLLPCRAMKSHRMRAAKC